MALPFKPLSPEMRKALLTQRAGLGRERDLIDMKSFTKGTFRIGPMPAGVFVPGVVFGKFYSKVLKKGSTALSTFGVDDPLQSALQATLDSVDIGDTTGMTKQQMKDAYKAARDEIGQICQYSMSMWLPVLWREFMGSPPRVRILPCGIKAYKQITQQMMATEEGEDVTDPDVGRWFIYEKEGTGFQTEYKVTFWHDRGPIDADPEVQAKCIQAFAVYDMRSKFWKPDFEAWALMYDAIVGEPADMDAIKAEFQQAVGNTAMQEGEEGHEEGTNGSASHSTPTTAAIAAAQSAPSQPAQSTPAATGLLELAVGAKVKFMVGDVEHTGKVLSLGDADAEGDIPFQALSAVTGQKIGVWKSIATVLPPDPAPKEATPTSAPSKKAAVTDAPAPKTATAAEEPPKEATKTKRPSVTASSTMKAKMAALKAKGKK